MRYIFKRCAGLDIHKRTVVACRVQVDQEGELLMETKTFGTMTADLLQLSDWLSQWEVSHVAMESTGDYWKPVFNLLEGDYEVLLVNAQHVKHVPGRKTDVHDAEWLGELLVYGLLKPSFIPPKPQRDLRDLTRYRTKLVQERARVVNRVQKLLENANIKLASVATDVLGVSGRRMLTALVDGETNVEVMAELAKGRLRNKIPELREALTGVVDDHHRFLLAQQLAHIDFLDEQIEEINAEIGRRLESISEPPHSNNESTPSQATENEDSAKILTWQEAVEIADTLPGVNERAATAILAEMGIDMNQFPSADHLSAWSGLAPGNHQSGGKRFSGRTRKGSRQLRTLMVQAAWSAVRTKNTYANALYHRLVGRRGKKRAIVAVARSLLVSLYHMLSRHELYQDLGADHFDNRRKDVKVDRLTRQLVKLGFTVHIEPVVA
jgi:transposase